jgi:hypothetical protein
MPSDSSKVIVALNFTSFAAAGPLPTDHIPRDQVCDHELDIWPQFETASRRSLSTKLLLLVPTLLDKLCRALLAMNQLTFGSL